MRPGAVAQWSDGGIAGSAKETDMSGDRTRRLFAAVDTKDADAFGAFLAEDARLTFGNAEPLVGRAAIVAGIDAFFTTIDGLRHRIVNEWYAGADTVVEIEVTYQRPDGKSVTVPAVSIWCSRADGLIADYRIFVDLAPVYAP
jgi:ketosteroid isomerase-like protein